MMKYQPLIVTLDQYSELRQETLSLIYVVSPVSRQYAMSELWGGGIPTPRTVDNSYPRLWVPSPYSLSPTRRSKPAFQWQGTNERIHRQWQQDTKRTQDRHGGHQFTYGSSVTSLVTGGTVFFSEQPGETITQQRGNSLLRVSLNITIYPSESFSGFRNRSLASYCELVLGISYIAT